MTAIKDIVSDGFILMLRKGITGSLREGSIVDDEEECESGDDFQTEDLDRIGTPRDAKLLCNLLSQLQNI